MDKYYIDLSREMLHKAIGSLQSAQNYITDSKLGIPRDYYGQIQRQINSIRRTMDDLGAVAALEKDAQ